MKIKPLQVLLALLVACSNTQQLVSNPDVACQELGASLAVNNVTVNFAEYVPAGTNITFTQNYNLSECGFTSLVVPNDFCRVAMYVATSNRSGITLETWLPKNWTGRFISTGNGGLSGCIQCKRRLETALAPFQANHADSSLGYTTSLGFASVGANGGHNGTSGEAFYKNPDILHDFSDLSMHLGVVIGKEITQKYYGEAYTKSYYLGCSSGGRQGFKAVQSYPEDFDGVVAGAPALDFVYLTSWSASFYKIFGDAGSPSYVPAGALWTSIHSEILKQCDGLDGAVDGVIEDPMLCYFRPEALLCKSGMTNSTTCLTSPQVHAVREALTDYYGVDGRLIYPRMQPGSEELAQYIYYTGGPFQYSVDYYRYAVYNDPTWNASSYSRSDAKLAGELNPFNIQTWNGDLSEFKNKGGKLLTYHGQQDAVITSENSPRYYNHVSTTMGLPSADLDEFYRFFRISGMDHCAGIDIGPTGVEVNTVPVTPKPNDILLRMVDWVENGNAPETLTGTKYVNGDPQQGVQFVRNHCKYPARNVYVGPQNYTSPEGWKCVKDSF